MKKTIYILLAVAALFFVIHGFIGKTATEKQVGEIFYRRLDNGVVNIYKSSANLKNEVLIYSHAGKSNLENQNVLGYYFEKSENAVYFVAITTKDNSEEALGLYKVVVGNSDAEFVDFCPENDGSGKFREYKIQKEINGMKADTKRGNLIVYTADKETELKQFTGLYSKKGNMGYIPVGFSPDGSSLVYTSKNKQNKFNDFISEKFDFKETTPPFYIVDISTKNSSKFVKGFDIQWVM